MYTDHAGKYHHRSSSPDAVYDEIHRHRPIAPSIVSIPFKVFHENMCYYYQHTTRGGRKGKPSVFLQLFQWQWRILRHRIRQGRAKLVEAFDNHVKDCMANLLEEGEEEVNRGTNILYGKAFVLSGWLSTPHAKLKATIECLGGRVWVGSPFSDECITVKWFLITNLRECDKHAKEVNESVAEGYLRECDKHAKEVNESVAEGYLRECDKHAKEVNESVAEGYLRECDKHAKEVNESVAEGYLRECDKHAKEVNESVAEGYLRECDKHAKEVNESVAEGYLRECDKHAKEVNESVAEGYLRECDKHAKEVNESVAEGYLRECDKHAKEVNESVAEGWQRGI